MIKRNAFTLVELVMVIVVFGIVAEIGAEIISKIYDGYFRTKTINQLESQAEIALEQIAKRLSYRVRGSEAVIRKPGVVNIFPLSSQESTDSILTWIGSSSESYKGFWSTVKRKFIPGWSGLIDFNSQKTDETNRTLMTPGSHLDFADKIIKSLTNNQISFENKQPALIPKTFKNTNIQNFYNNTNTNYTIKVNQAANDVFKIPLGESTPTYPGINGGQGLSDEYYLVHTAYAIVPEGIDANDFNLTLRYNYQPWHGDEYNSADTSNTILVEHVSTFRFRKDADAIRLKLCLKDTNQQVDYNMSACKETVVF